MERVQTLLGRPYPFLFPFSSPDPHSHRRLLTMPVAPLCIAYVFLIVWNALHCLLHLGAHTPPSEPGQVLLPLRTFLTPLGINCAATSCSYSYYNPHNTALHICLSHWHLKPLKGCNLFIPLFQCLIVMATSIFGICS